MFISASFLFSVIQVAGVQVTDDANINICEHSQKLNLRFKIMLLYIVNSIGNEKNAADTTFWCFTKFND